MLPERIALQGFLCYREPQEAIFTGRPLWMLAGPNGSGKSSLFDAVTFALYGIHRGGKHNAEALINRHEDGFIVEFDFRLGDDLFRARRTLRRGQSVTRQILHFLPDGHAGQWREVAGTDSAGGFSRWVADNIGLTEKTFLASVLLRQGDAERLLNADPAERHRFLAEIVGLDHYQRLHQLAKDRHTAARTLADNLATRLTQAPEVPDNDLAAAEATLAEATRAAADSAAHIQSLQELHHHAQTWHALDRQRRDLTRRHSDLTHLLRDRDHIETQHTRLQLLTRHLPTLDRCAQLQADVTTTRHQLTQLQEQTEQLIPQHTRLTTTLAATASAIAHQEEIIDRLVTLQRDTEREHAQLATLIPTLAALDHHRRAWLQAQHDLEAADTTLATLQPQRDTLLADLPTPEALQAADDARQRARDRLTEAAAHCRLAEENWNRFHEATQSPTCRYCGQHLPPTHIESELARLQQQRDHARQACRQAQQDSDAATHHHQSLHTRHQTTDRALRTLDRQIQHHIQARQSALHQQQQAAQSWTQTLQHLPPHLHPHTLSAPPTTTPPDDACLFSPQHLAQRSQALDQTLTHLDSELTDARAQLATLTDEQTRLQSALHALNQKQESLRLETAKHETTLSHLQTTLAATRHTLPDQWQTNPDSDLAPLAATLRRELDDLESADISARHAALTQAQQDLATLDARLEDLRAQIDRIPPPARRDPAHVAHDLADAQRTHTAREQTARQAQHHLETLHHRRAHRADLLADHRRADRQRHLWAKLAEALGPRGLQRDLVRRAERQIVEYANAILDRLAAGTLHVELAPETDDDAPRALDLRVRTATSPQPLDAPLLSGSQKFRLAVALSLATARAAPHTRHPIRAAIIDEGFGCLDAENRHVMIQELHNLRTHLDRILLVSHQDDFAQAFPDGYHCHPTAQGTRLIPFHR